MVQLHRMLLPLLVLLLTHNASCQRVLIKHDTQHGPAIIESARKLGLSLVGEASSLLVLEGKAKGAARTTRAQSIVAKARSWPGVIAVEQDQPRYMHRPFTASTPGQSGPGFFLEDCTLQDKPVSNGTWPEYQPYGMSMIQATSKKLLNSTEKAGVVVCIIDSGIDSKQPDLIANEIDGCKYEDAFAPAGCPFDWSGDLVGHGTHVAGTIAAQKNGFGVVGVIPGPAELYIVRVFNNTGDVNQGQGLVYGSTLILAFTQCEGRLVAQQAASPDKNYRMVVSMSLGAAGPLTIEKMFFREALSRGDILFVASSGNNGTAETLKNGILSDSINPGNYPGAYPEVISVAAVDCGSNLAPFSQKHPSVDLAAPGVDILSTASTAVVDGDANTAGAFLSETPKIFIEPGTSMSGNQIKNGGSGKVTGKVVFCGSDTRVPCPEAKGEICFVQYDPDMKQIETAAQPSPNATSNGGVSGRPTGIPRPVGTAPATSAGTRFKPSRFYCHLMEYCMQQGAKAMMMAGPSITSKYYPSWLTVKPEDVLDVPVFANFNCTSYGCDCWARIEGKPRLPAVGLNLRQFAEVKLAVEAANKSGKPFIGTVDAKLNAYQRLSGTSMAVPHVSGGLARLWASYPYCTGSIIRTAVEQTAKDLGPRGRDVMFGHGLLQLEAAHDYLAKQPCAKGPRDPLPNGLTEQDAGNLAIFARESKWYGSNSGKKKVETGKGNKKADR